MYYKRIIDLIEETEAHILIGFLLLDLLGLLGSGSSRSSSTRSGGGSSGTTSRHGSELTETLSNDLEILTIRPNIIMIKYGIDVLSLELGDQILSLSSVDLNTNGSEDLLDISNGGGLVTTEGSEHVGSNVTHYLQRIRMDGKGISRNEP